MTNSDAVRNVGSSSARVCIGTPVKVRRECAADGCSLDFYCQGYCSSHYRRFLKYGDPLGTFVRPPRPLCSIKGCERFALPRGLCNLHEGRLQRHGNPVAGQYRAPKGSDDITYAAAHCRVYKVRGKASNYTCPCGARAKDWSLRNIADPKRDMTRNKCFRGLRYSTDIDDYIALCRSCNLRGDREFRAGSATVFVDTVRAVISVEEPMPLHV